MSVRYFKTEKFQIRAYHIEQVSFAYLNCWNECNVYNFRLDMHITNSPDHIVYEEGGYLCIRYSGTCDSSGELNKVKILSEYNTDKEYLDEINRYKTMKELTS